MRQALPLLKPCQGGVAYSDGQFDDARLNPVSYTHLTLPTICSV